MKPLIFVAAHKLCHRPQTLNPEARGTDLQAAVKSRIQWSTKFSEQQPENENEGPQEPGASGMTINGY